jgi:cell division GTPase FtsZ
MAIDAAINAFDQIDSLITENTKTVILIANLGDIIGTGYIVIAQIAKKKEEICCCNCIYTF